MNNEFHPGISPMDQANREIAVGRQADMGKAEWETIIGLEGAIDATEKRIAQYKTAGIDVSELDEHLGNLRKSLLRSVNEAIMATHGRITKYKMEGADVSFLERHLENLKQKLSKPEDAENYPKAA